MNKKHITIALVLNIITCAFYITFFAMSIIDKSWGYAAIALCLFVCHTVLVKEIRKKERKGSLTPVIDTSSLIQEQNKELKH